MIAQFGYQSTADEVLAGLDLSGWRVMVTGVSAGLGVETAPRPRRPRRLCGRCSARPRQGPLRHGKRRGIGKTGGGLKLINLDLASLADVRRCADVLLAEGQPFDAVIANAGVMACPKGITADGFETQLGTNHLGHFVLVNRIAPLMHEGARLVVLASAGHRYADVDLDDPGFERTEYDPVIAYGRSKTANILFAVEFDRRHQGNGVRAAAVHPGGIQTELTRHIDPARLEGMVAQINRDLADQGAPSFKLKTVPQGRGHFGLGSRASEGERDRWPLLRKLSCKPRRTRRLGDHAGQRRCARLRGRPSSSPGAVAQERADGGRTL